MKIKLFYIHPTNYGNLMMACAFMSNFDQILKKRGECAPEFYLDVLDDEELDRVRRALTNGIVVKRENLYDRKRRGISGKLLKLSNLPREISYNRSFYDVCVVLGGDCISQYYSPQVFISDLVKFKMICPKREVYLLGQTMGPFHGYANGLVKSCLKNSRIYVRDHDCYIYLKNDFGFDQLYEARDLAFLDIPFQNDPKQKKLVQKQYVGDEAYITIVPSGANRQYTSDEAAYLNEYIKIIEYVIDSTPYDILLLAHVIHVADSNDKRILDKIVDMLPKRYLERIHVANTLMLPHEARILQGGGLATITGRMHAAVSSINMGTVPICLSYSVKYKGVIGDDFDLNEYIYQCRGDETWKNGQVHKNVIRMLCSALDRREELVSQISQRLKTVQQRAYWQIEQFAEEQKGFQKE